MTLLNDNDWSVVDGEVCRITEFVSMATMKDGVISALDSATPYASVTLESIKLPKDTKGFITHKLDFQHLWVAFKERGVGENEEVLIFWTKKHLKPAAKLLAVAMPRLWVMICQKNAYELWTDPSYRPELGGEARFLAQRAITEWKPDVMK